MIFDKVRFVRHAERVSSGLQMWPNKVPDMIEWYGA